MIFLTPKKLFPRLVWGPGLGSGMPILIRQVFGVFLLLRNVLFPLEGSEL